MLIELPFTYNFNHALVRLAGDPVNQVDLEKQLVFIPMKEGNVIELQAIGMKEQPSFIIEGALNEQQINRVKEIFHFHQSLDKVTSHFQRTDLVDIFTKFEGMPLIRSFSLYGNLMKSIIHQQLNLSFSNTLTLRFVEKYGRLVNGVWVYPTPGKIAALQVSELRELQFSERKAEYMIHLSKVVASGELDLEKLRDLPDEEVVKILTGYRGIGPWTAQNFLLFGLGRPNLFPTADVGLQNALKRVWQMDRKPTKDEVLNAVSQWEPYSSYAALYLWKSIELKA